MSKQQELIEGIENIISDKGYYFPYAEATLDILSYLHSRGVVIGVARYFPSKDAGESNIQYCAGWYDCFHKAIDAGYVATEPLIEGA